MAEWAVNPETSIMPTLKHCIVILSLMSLFSTTAASQGVEIDSACSYLLTPWHQGCGSDDQLAFGYCYGTRDTWCFYIMDEMTFMKALDSNTLELDNLPILVDHCHNVTPDPLSVKSYWAFSPLKILHYLDNAYIYKIGTQLFSVCRVSYAYIKNVEITVDTDVILWDDNYTKETDTVISIPISDLRKNKEVRFFYHLIDIVKIPKELGERRWRTRYELILSDPRKSYPNPLNMAP